MKFLWSVLLMAISSLTNAQTIELKLSGATQRKWIGQHTYTDDVNTNKNILTISKDHTYTTNTVTVAKKKRKLTWSIEKGNYTNDEIVIRLDKTLYLLEFLQSSNGKDMMTLTKVPAHTEEPVSILTYIAD